MRKRQRVSVALVMALCGLALVGEAIAAPPVTGSWTKYIGPAAGSTQLSFGYATWSATASPKTVLLQAEGYALPSGTCETTYFDWLIGSGEGSSHFDARGARDCRAVGYDANKRWNETTAAFRVVGVQKLGVCYGTNNARGSCVDYPGAGTSSIPSNWTQDQGLSCISWVRRESASAALISNSGGDARSCSN